VTRITRSVATGLGLFVNGIEAKGFNGKGREESPRRAPKKTEIPEPKRKGRELKDLNYFANFAIVAVRSC
jgi:hypothetical protein